MAHVLSYPLENIVSNNGVKCDKESILRFSESIHPTVDDQTQDQ